MKKLIILFLYVLLTLIPVSCIYDDLDGTVPVIKIENTIISYWDIDDNHWHCREALIYDGSKSRDVKFPIQYEGEIIEGTQITYHCYNVTAYYKNGKKILIDWDKCKLDD